MPWGRTSTSDRALRFAAWYADRVNAVSRVIYWTSHLTPKRSWGDEDATWWFAFVKKSNCRAARKKFDKRISGDHSYRSSSPDSTGFDESTIENERKVVVDRAADVLRCVSLLRRCLE